MLQETFVAKATDILDDSISASSQCPLQPSGLPLPSFPQQPTLPQFFPQATATSKFFSQPNAVQSIPEAAKQINPSGNSPLTPSGNSQFAHWSVSTPTALSKDSPLMQSDDITCISSNNSPCTQSDSPNFTSSPVNSSQNHSRQFYQPFSTSPPTEVQKEPYKQKKRRYNADPVERLLEESAVIVVCCQSIETEDSNTMENIHFYRIHTHTDKRSHPCQCSCSGNINHLEILTHLDRIEGKLVRQCN